MPASPPVGDSRLLSCCTRQVNLDNLTAATDLHFPFKAFRELGVTVCLASYMNSVQPKGKGGKDYTRPHVRVGARLPYGGRRNSG